MTLRDRARRVVQPTTVGLVLVTALAVALRVSMWNGFNTDVENFREWLQFIRDNGGMRAFKHEIGDYTPFYPYLLFVGDHLLVGASDNTVIRFPALLADVVCAAFVYRIVRLRHPAGLLPLIAYGTILFAPTVAINSGYWGQVDMLWAAALVGAVYMLLLGRDAVALVLVGVSLAIKQQALFLAPFLLVLWLRRKIRWWCFLLVPAVYLLSVLPAKLAGGSSRALLTIYLDQADEYRELTLNAPTVFMWLPESRSEDFDRPAVIWGVGVLALLVLATVAYLPRLTPELTIALATASVLVMPFVLPKMHERYFFAADILTIVLAFYVPRLLPVAVLVQIISLFSYWPFLFEGDVFSGPVLALGELVAVLVLLGWIALRIRELGGGRRMPLYGAPDA